MTTFQDARTFLLKHRTDYDAAVKGFCWPDPVPFNWALDWFDAELASNADSKDHTPADDWTSPAHYACEQRESRISHRSRAPGSPTTPSVE